MTTLKQEFMKAAIETPRMFFAPIVGAIRAVAHELTFPAKKKKAAKSVKKVVLNSGAYRRHRVSVRGNRGEVIAVVFEEPKAKE